MKQALLILPFQNLGFSTDDEYLSDGITEELIGSLTRLDHIQVASRTSSFYFKGKHFSLNEINERLSVSHLLEGSIRRHEQQLRIVVNLTELQSGFTLWSETFDKDASDLLKVQDEIANEIVKKFKPEILSNGAETLDMSMVPNSDHQAYDEYLKGLYYYNGYTMDNIAKAVDFFQKAIRRQPQFALAHATLGQSYMALGGYVHPSNYALAKKSVIRAVAIDPQLIQAQIPLAMVQLFYDWDVEGAYKTLRKALDLDIRSADAHRFSGVLSLYAGQADEAVYAHELATKYDPLNVIYIKGLGWSLAAKRRYEEAFKEYERCLEIDPSFYPALEGMGWICVYQKRWKEAIQYFKQYQQIVKHPLKGWFGLGYAYAKTGNIEGAYEILQRLDKRRDDDVSEILDLDYALIYLGLGDLDKTFSFLNNAVDNHHIITLVSLSTEPVFDEIRSDERFQYLLNKIGLDTSHKRMLSRKTLNDVLVVQSDTKERLEILSAQLLFVEAQGNYSKFVWLEGKGPQERLLRISLSSVAEQLEQKYTLQVHRSYIANLSTFDEIKRETRQSYLLNSQHEIRVPISRTKTTAIKKLFENIKLS